ALDAVGGPELVVVTHTASGQGLLKVFPGVGDGTFGPATDYPMTSPGAAVALADLDGDGDLDVVVARDGPSVVAPAGVFLGNGNGTLGAMTTYGSGGSARAVAVGHIDSDPWQELVLGGTAGVRVLKGLAGGAFGAQSSYLDGISIDAVGIADVDADGRREVPAVSAGRNAISVLAFDLSG